MGLFDFFKSQATKPTIDLTDFKFLSDDHTRYENGKPTNANNKGAWRGIRIKTSDNNTFYVTMYNMNENHPVWGDNVQMAEKRMKIISKSSEKIILRGHGNDAMGASFSDYGITIHISSSNVDSITLHMHDRNVDILYIKAVSRKQSEVINQYSDFDSFKAYFHKWNTSMPMQDKLQIARESDALNNRGCDLFNDGDLDGAIKYYVKALTVMPINDDVLKNLKICYSRIGKYDKISDIERKLNYLA